ncbi:MAG TPA: hypothetical protein VIW64_15100 [Pyrinomonadaceae bacterium]|jgi:DNA-directed RNA polymerase specialized sigma24 family protein
MKRERDPTSEEFQKLLHWLASSGTDYEIMHRRLVKILLTKQCFDAEALADEVMNRVAVRIDDVVSRYTDPPRCLQGFEKNVYREALEDRMKLVHVDPPPPKPEPDDERELKDRCLTHCLGELDPAEADLFRGYFPPPGVSPKKARRELAAKLKLSANALRIKAHRVRKILRLCMESCVEEYRQR